MRKIPTRLLVTNFCTSSACFAPSFVKQPNGSKCTQIVRIAENISLGSNGVDQVRTLRKILTRLRGTNFCTSSPCFAPNFVRQPNGPKCTQIVRNAPNINLESNGVDQVRSLRKIPTRLRGTNFCTSLARFAPSFVRQTNGPKCTQIVQNAPKYQIWVQWGGSDAFVAENTDATSWHKLLH